MLVYIAIDPECLRSEETSQAERDMIIRDLLEFGIPVRHGDDLNKLKSLLDQETMRALREVLKKLPTMRLTRPLDSEPIDGHPSELKSPTVVLLGERLAPQWLAACDADPLATSGVHPQTGVEVLRATAITRSTELTKAKELARASFLPTDTGLDAWERLAVLCRASTRVTVVDPFLFAHVEQRDLGVAGRKGLFWLMDRFGSDRQLLLDPIDLVLYGQLPDPPWSEPEQLDQLADDLHRRCRGAIRQLRIIAVPQRRFKEKEHGRYLRFGSDGIERTVVLDHSLDQFSDGHFSVRVGYRYSILQSRELMHFDDVEATLRDHAADSGGVRIRGS